MTNEPETPQWHYSIGFRHGGCLCRCTDGRHSPSLHMNKNEANAQQQEAVALKLANERLRVKAALADEHAKSLTARCPACRTSHARTHEKTLNGWYSTKHYMPIFESEALGIQPHFSDGDFVYCTSQDQWLAGYDALTPTVSNEEAYLAELCAICRCDRNWHSGGVMNATHDFEPTLHEEVT